MTETLLSSRTLHLMGELERLNFQQARLALDLVMSIMNKENGYKRHDGSHYYHHLVDVAQICINLQIKDNQDENLIIAALLHDIVEDVPGYTFEKIANMFNLRVANIVKLLTKNKNVNYHIPENIIYYLECILEDEDASILKTLDRIHNFGTLRHATFEKKVRQAKETEEFFIPFFKEARKKYNHYANVFFFAKTIIEPHLWEIMEHQKTMIENEKLKAEIMDKKNRLN